MDGLLNIINLMLENKEKKTVNKLENTQLLRKDIGFDSVTNYVLLPEWKGPEKQDYIECGKKRIGDWKSIGRQVGLLYYPSVSPGWDATARAADFGKPKPKRYPWSPIVTGSNPDNFAWLLDKAVSHVEKREKDPLVFIASWNEWSEGHYLEPDKVFGLGWLEAVKRVLNR